MTGEVVLVDSGGANIGSVVYALDRLNIRSRLSRDSAVIANADRVILPGVGAAPKGMSRLNDLGLARTIAGLTQPVLGICLGMQLMYQGSDEGNVDCLGIFSGQASLLPADTAHRVPHMGWNALNMSRQCPLFDGVPEGSHVYFVHSYALPVTGDTVGVSEHGVAFSAAAWKDNFFATQFHPERSAEVGETILRNFVRL